WVRDPITVSFSEPLRPSTVSPQSVRLSATGAVLLSATPGLSADGRTLTVAPASLPSVPNTLTLTLAGLTDGAGDALPTQSWSWTLPEWQAPPGADPLPDPAAQGFEPRLARGPDGTLFLAYERADGIALERFTAGAWQPVGPAWQPVAGSSLYLQGLAVDPAGRPVAALLDSAGGALSGYAGRWTGSAWETLGGPISADPGNELGPLELALDPTGIPTVAAAELTSTGGYAQVWRLAAGAWNSPGPALNFSPTGPQLWGLALGGGEARMLLGVLDGGTWKGLLAHETGSTWDAQTGPLVAPAGGDLGPSSLAVDAQGVVTVATTVPDGAGGFQGLVARPANGTWAPLGASAGPARAVRPPPLALDANGQPVVAFETPDRKAVVRRWSGSAWLDVAGAFHAAAGEGTVPSSMVLDDSGNPWLAVVDVTGLNAQSYVLRLNR
ncbi:MAG TPA: Ig-like domain-containing protein, partial [Deinococcales bacterium]|nr:Ig-like domain-containing protein [Deinococcales bacterium]